MHHPPLHKDTAHNRPPLGHIPMLFDQDVVLGREPGGTAADPGRVAIANRDIPGSAPHRRIDSAMTASKTSATSNCERAMDARTVAQRPLDGPVPVLGGQQAGDPDGDRGLVGEDGHQGDLVVTEGVTVDPPEAKSADQALIGADGNARE